MASMSRVDHRFALLIVQLLAVGLTVVLGGCNPATPASGASASPSAIGPTASTAPPDPSTSTSDDSSPAAPAGQTDTDWGRIWDELPVAFLVYPGAVPANEAQTDAVSATFAIDGAEPRPVALWMQAELERTGFRTEALNGPFEDGSFVLESRGTADCRIEVAVAPLGSLTTVTVRYGAACPSP